ncbi:GtrA family protein [Rhodanobacter sp. LX-100]|nr:GtrA family protein [Rhodanobacter sp. LX-99]MBT2147642.1 GtrA family protein [Rhodanobacter sp. LX-100]
MRLMRFGITGLMATGIHVVVAVTLITRLSMLPYMANPIAFLTATGFSYATNTLWSFSSRMSRPTLLRYACVSLFGCLATMAIAAAAEAAHLDYRIGILLVIALVTPATFALHSLWTYRSAR